MRFLSKKHEMQYVTLLQLDKTHPKDVERLALFYIISGNQDLFVKSKAIYNFLEHLIEPDCLNRSAVDFSSSSRALIKLGV